MFVQDAADVVPVEGPVEYAPVATVSKLRLLPAGAQDLHVLQEIEQSAVVVVQGVVYYLVQISEVVQDT